MAISNDQNHVKDIQVATRIVCLCSKRSVNYKDTLVAQDHSISSDTNGSVCCPDCSKCSGAMLMCILGCLVL